MVFPKNLFKDFRFPNYVILEGYRGSISHGVYVKGYIDDKDLFGVFIPPKEYIMGLKEYDHYEKQNGEWDVLYYSLKKFIHLALKGNPNVLCLLWLRKNDYTSIGEEGRILIDNKKIFSSKLCYHSFVGYAYGQLRQMEKFNKEGYMGEKRMRLVKEFGYDVKNAAHLIRLLRMGIEFLTSGQLNVFRKTDRQQLLAIKMGEWTLEQVKEEAKKLFALADEAYVRSKLSDQPDRERANKLLIDLHESFWAKGKY